MDTEAWPRSIFQGLARWERAFMEIMENLPISHIAYPIGGEKATT
jgi:hypothetical protein